MTMNEVKIPRWLEEAVELHYNCENYECGCDPSDMSLCLAGRYAEGNMDESDIQEIIQDAELEEKETIIV